MSYTKLTDFAAKDALLSGNPSKLLRGTEIDAEFSSLQTEMVLLAPKTGTGATGTWDISVTGNAATATNATNVTGTIASAVTATTQAASDNSTYVATTAMVQSALLGGSGQTMQDLTVSRAINTTYTNSTGRTIAVFVTLSVGPNVSWLMYVGSNLVGYDFQVNASNRQTTLFALVPPGATYSTAGGLGVYNWKELR